MIILSEPLAYVFHGECKLPIDTEIYTGCMVLPNHTMHVRRNLGKVTVAHLKEVGITMDPELEQDLKLKRVEILGARAYTNHPKYANLLNSLGLERMDFSNLYFGRIRDFYRKEISDKEIFTLYTASPRNDPREGDVTAIALTLHLAQDSDCIEEILHRLHKDERQAAK